MLESEVLQLIAKTSFKVPLIPLIMRMMQFITLLNDRK